MVEQSGQQLLVGRIELCDEAGEHTGSVRLPVEHLVHPVRGQRRVCVPRLTNEAEGIRPAHSLAFKGSLGVQAGERGHHGGVGGVVTEFVSHLCRRQGAVAGGEAGQDLPLQAAPFP